MVLPMKLTLTTQPLCPSSTCAQTSSSRSQTRHVKSSDAVAAMVPSKLMATSNTLPRPPPATPCPCSSCSHVPSAKDHTRPVLSSLTVTHRRPCLSIATALTLAWWPSSTCLIWPVSRSHKQQCPSWLAIQHRLPPGATSTSTRGTSRASCMTQSPTFMSHTCAAPSSEIVITSWPLGLMTTFLIGMVWLRRVILCKPPACCREAVRGSRCTSV
mmetsp:Transcript_7408/g.19761  ORF Transcript_7408/g.19761 Transcript_7408/m.19761 type:complete len:214 (-) Transcript_7408:1297-1938(-)